MLTLKTFILTTALVLILIGIWHEEKLIAFEEKVWDYIADRIGWLAAQIVITYRKIKKHR
jgi:hypothetical membrane protein